MSSIDRTRTNAARERTVERKCARHVKRGNLAVTRGGHARRIERGE